MEGLMDLVYKAFPLGIWQCGILSFNPPVNPTLNILRGFKIKSQGLPDFLYFLASHKNMIAADQENSMTKFLKKRVDSDSLYDNI